MNLACIIVDFNISSVIKHDCINLFNNRINFLKVYRSCSFEI